jgi:hypothetical protein
MLRPGAYIPNSLVLVFDVYRNSGQLTNYWSTAAQSTATSVSPDPDTFLHHYFIQSVYCLQPVNGINIVNTGLWTVNITYELGFHFNFADSLN